MQETLCRVGSLACLLYPFPDRPERLLHHFVWGVLNHQIVCLHLQVQHYRGTQVTLVQHDFCNAGVAVVNIALFYISASRSFEVSPACW